MGILGLSWSRADQKNKSATTKMKKEKKEEQGEEDYRDGGRAGLENISDLCTQGALPLGTYSGDDDDDNDNDAKTTQSTVVFLLTYLSPNPFCSLSLSHCLSTLFALADAPDGWFHPPQYTVALAAAAAADIH